MNEKTIFLLIFLVSTALLLYVEATDNNDNQNNPEYQESSDTHNTAGDYAQPIQEVNRPDVLSY